MELWQVTALVSAGLAVGVAALLRRRLAPAPSSPAEILKTTPRAEVATAEEGATVAIVGTVRHLAEVPLEAPITGTKCVAYSSRVRRTKTKAAIPWILEKEHQDFLIVDKTGAALIPRGRLVLTREGHRVSGAPTEASGNLASLLNRHGQSGAPDESQIMGAIDFEEQILPLDTKVIVRGVVRRDEAASRNGAAITLLPSADEPVLIVDDPAYF